MYDCFWQVYKVGIKLNDWLTIKNYITYKIEKQYKMPTGDRDILENDIFQLINNICVNDNILFIGVHKYSSWYAHLFNSLTNNRFYTIDKEYDYNDTPYSNSFAIKDDFIFYTDSKKYKVIILNGVFGYGIDKEMDQIKAFKKIDFMLENNGYFILGYRKGTSNDILPSSLAYFKNKKYSLKRSYLANKSNNHILDIYKKELK